MAATQRALAVKWFRFYAEFAHDPKVQSMPEVMQRRLCVIFCLHCEGTLAGLDDEMLAFALKITPEELEETRTLFRKRGFIGKSWVPSNWEKRQFRSDTSAERTRRYRHKISGVTSQNPKGDVTVTGQKRHGDALDTDTESDTESETEKSVSPNPQGGGDTHTHSLHESGEQLPTPQIAPGRSPEDRAEVEAAIAILIADLRTYAVGIELGRRHNGRDESQIKGWRWQIAAQKLQGPGITTDKMESFPYLAAIARNVQDDERVSAKPKPGGTPPENGVLGQLPDNLKTKAQLRADHDKAAVERMLARKKREREEEAARAAQGA